MLFASDAAAHAEVLARGIVEFVDGAEDGSVPIAPFNIAAGRFTAVLPAEALPEEASLEPDRLDGRRLATACLWAAVIVILAFLGLSPLGAPIELLVPLAVVAFLILVYTLSPFSAAAQG
ncbi:hypothetical protein [Streptomyces ureilyticus]|uniref:Uncharacterized protein n=1 Tax=Streptomyces ureilyticus TaxID=1775131 RepID=A0ABX0DTW9_9ACTN|nr:hypothetical protein [Streptomyces ureilyticus]NGO45371.1 hypothetical protein [Streptomyces ureilyticus]